VTVDDGRGHYDHSAHRRLVLAFLATTRSSGWLCWSFGFVHGASYGAPTGRVSTSRRARRGLREPASSSRPARSLFATMMASHGETLSSSVARRDAFALCCPGFIGLTATRCCRRRTSRSSRLPLDGLWSSSRGLTTSSSAATFSRSPSPSVGVLLFALSSCFDNPRGIRRTPDNRENSRWAPHRPLPEFPQTGRWVMIACSGFWRLRRAGRARATKRRNRRRAPKERRR